MGFVSLGALIGILMDVKNHLNTIHQTVKATYFFGLDKQVKQKGRRCHNVMLNFESKRYSIDTQGSS